MQPLNVPMGIVRDVICRFLARGHNTITSSHLLLVAQQLSQIANACADLAMQKRQNETWADFEKRIDKDEQM